MNAIIITAVAFHLLAGWLPFQLRNDIDKNTEKLIVNEQESEVKIMEFRIKQSLLVLAKEGIQMYDIGEDYKLILIHEENEEFTVIVCKEEVLNDIMKEVTSGDK